MKILINIASVITASILALMLLLPFIHPNILSPITLAFPYIVILNAIMLVLLLIFRCFKSAIIMAIVLAVSFPAARRSIVMLHNSTDEPTDSTKELTILTYNIEIFKSYTTVEPILSLIRKESPDIVCMQEFGHYYNNRPIVNRILASFDSIYPYRHLWYKNQVDGNESGLVLFSKYPIVNKQKLEYESKNNISVYSDIVIGKDTIRVINNHLESNRLTATEREITDNPTDTSRMKSIYHKMVASAHIRADQADSIASLIKKTRYPLIVVGDFNDIPQSYTYQHILYSKNEQGESFHDAYADAGEFGMYHTYNQNHLDVAIDHILYTKPIKAIKTTILKVDYSDHYPLLSRLAIE